MRIIIGNVQCQAVIGPEDYSYPFDLYDTLRCFLREHPPGFERVPAYNRRKSDGTRQWDGYTYLFNTNKIFGTGFLPRVLKYMDDLKVSYVIDDQRGFVPRFKEQFETYLGVEDGTERHLRDYQEKVVRACDNWIPYGDNQELYFPRGIINAATNAGKNSIMIGIVKNVDVEPRAIMVLHSQEIFKQAVETFSQYFDGKIGVIDSKNYKLSSFTVAMYKSLCNKLEKSVNVRSDMARFNMLFVDEAHRIGGTEYVDTLAAIPAPLRFLVSGTPLDTPEPLPKMIRIGLSGEEFSVKLTNQDLIKAGVSLEPHVHVLLNRGKAGYYGTYLEEYDAMVKNSDDRMAALKDFLREDARKDDCTLIAFWDIAHGYAMYDNLKKDSRFEHLRIQVVNAEDPARDAKLAAFKNGEIDILLGSTIMQEGLNIPRIRILVYAIGGQSKVRVKQFVGRLTRHDGVSDAVEVVDFYDPGQWVEKHCRTRIRYYKEEGFKLTYHFPVDRYGKPTGIAPAIKGFAIR